MQNKNLIFFLRYAAIAGNMLFVLWVSFNAMDEGFQGNLVEKLSGAGLIGLLALNCYLLLAGKRQGEFMEQKTGK